MFWIGIFLDTEVCKWVTVYSGKYGTWRENSTGNALLQFFWVIRYFNGTLKTYVAEMRSALIIKISAWSAHYLLIYKYIPGLWTNGFLTQHWRCCLPERIFICCESFKHYTNECKKFKTAIPSFLPSNSKCLECITDLMLCLAFHSC